MSRALARYGLHKSATALHLTITHPPSSCHKNGSIPSQQVSYLDSNHHRKKMKMQTHRLIRTTSRRPIQVRSQVDPQALPLTYIPCRHILALNAGRTPCESIALVCESAKRVLRGGEGDRQVIGGSVWCFANVGVQLRALRVNQLDQLAIDYLELPGGRGVREDCPAWRGVQRGGLQVFVVVWSRDGADPGIAALEGWACAGTRGAATCGGSRARGRRSGSGGSAGSDGDGRGTPGRRRTRCSGRRGGGTKGSRGCRRSDWLALGIIVVQDYTCAPRCACLSARPASAAAF